MLRSQIFILPPRSSPPAARTQRSATPRSQRHPLQGQHSHSSLAKPSHTMAAKELAQKGVAALEKVTAVSQDSDASGALQPRLVKACKARCRCHRPGPPPPLPPTARACCCTVGGTACLDAGRPLTPRSRAHAQLVCGSTRRHARARLAPAFAPTCLPPRGSLPPLQAVQVVTAWKAGLGVAVTSGAGFAVKKVSTEADGTAKVGGQGAAACAAPDARAVRPPPPPRMHPPTPTLRSGARRSSSPPRACR